MLGGQEKKGDRNKVGLTNRHTFSFFPPILS